LHRQWPGPRDRYRRTAAVLGRGINLIYPPENLALYRKIEDNGAILSEFPFGRRADRQSFAMRNRIVSGMSMAVIVVETDVAGGSMITARFAGEQGRQIFAVPGRIDQPTSAGCHQLIRDGATLLTSVDDVLNEFSYLDGLRPAAIAARDGTAAAESTAAGAQLTEEETRVWACFSGGTAATPDDIARRTGMGAAEVSVALMMLELKHLVAKRADGSYEAR
jgi:DNA processing protein